MIRLSLNLILFVFALLFSLNKSIAQAQCGNNTQYYFDEGCFHRTGEIKLGQAQVDVWNSILKVEIPDDRKEWAVALAFDHSLFHNLMGKDFISINEYLATTVQESNVGCDHAVEELPNNAYCSMVGVAGGFFQEEKTTGWAEMSATMPCVFGTLVYEDQVWGDNFETSSLVKVYHDIQNMMILQNFKCHDILGFIEESADPYAAEKLVSCYYNRGYNWFIGDKMFGVDRNVAVNNPELLDHLKSPYSDDNTSLKTSLGGVYAEQITRITKALDNNIGAINVNYADDGLITNTNIAATHKFLGFYDEQIAWDDIQTFINEVKDFYEPLGVDVNAVITKVKKKFDGLTGCNSTLSFRYEMGEVIDELVMSLPAFDFMPGLNQKYSNSYNCDAPPTATITALTNSACPGDPVQLQVEFTGNGPFDFEWAKNNTFTKVKNVTSPYTFSASGPGKYYVTYVEDQRSESNIHCRPELKAEIPNGNCGCTPPPKAEIISANPITFCSEEEICLISNLEEGYEYTWFMDGSPIQGFEGVMEGSVLKTNLPFGSHVLKVRIADPANPNDPNCYLEDEIQVQIGLKTEADTSMVTCAGADGEIEISIITGMAPYEYKINGVGAFDGNNVFTGLSEGTYSIVTQDASSCRDTVEVVLDKVLGCIDPCVSPTVKFTAIKDAFCPGDSAELQLELTGEGPWEILLNNGVRIPNITDSVYTFFTSITGDYSVDSVYDVNTCPEEGDGNQISVEEYDPVKPDLGSDLYVCTEEFPVTLDAGLDFLSYEWNIDGQLNQTISLDNGGEFWVKTTDQNGCASADTLTLEELLIIKPDLGMDVVICAGKNVALKSDGTYADYTWGPNGEVTDSLVVNAADVYTLVVSSDSGCVARDTLEVIVGDLTLDLGDDRTICFGDSLRFELTEKYEKYEWIGFDLDSNVFEVGELAMGDYLVQLNVENSIGCKATDQFTLTVQSEMTVDIGNDSTFICKGSSIVLNSTVVGGDLDYSHVWNDLTTGLSLTANAVGMYTLHVTDGRGCKAADSIYIKMNDNLKVELSDSSICVGEEVILNSGYDTGNYTVDWNTSETSQQITINQTGIYGVVVEDANGCSGSDSMELTVNDLPDLELGDDQVVCSGATADLTSNLDFNAYSWSNLETTKSISVSSGKFYLVVTDQNNCSNIDSVEVTEVAQLEIDELQDAGICVGNDILFDASGFDNGYGPFQYTWSDATTANSLQLTGLTIDELVWVEIEDANGCIGRDSANVVISDSLLVQLSAVKGGEVCIGETEKLYSNFSNANGYTLLWQETGATTDTLSGSWNTEGTEEFSLLVADPNGCVGLEKITVTVHGLPDLTSVTDAYSFCASDSVEIGNDLGIGYTYNWKETGETNPLITVKQGGSFTLEIVDKNGCLNEKVIVVTESQLPIVDLGEDHELCENDSIVLQNKQANLNAVSTWKGILQGNLGNATEVIAKQSDQYILELIAGSNCIASDTVEVIVKPTPSIDLGNDRSICEGDQIVIDAETTSNQLEWSNDTDGKSITVTQGGLYWAKAFDGDCFDADSVNVTEDHYPVIGWDYSLEDRTTCFATERGMFLTANEDLSYQYKWSPGGQTSNAILIEGGGTYEVEVFNGMCSSTEVITFIDYCKTSFYIPNSFTPNDDGVNDYFFPKGEFIADFNMEVYNRWGELIFTGSNMGTGWDGTVNGVEVQEDVYVWRITYSENAPGSLPAQLVRVGHVSVIR